MVRITYKNFLSKKIDSKFTSQTLFTDVNSLVRQTDHTVIYTLCPIHTVESVKRQANAFSEKLVSRGYFKNSFLDNAYRLNDELTHLVRDTYIYSFCKSLVEGTERRTTRSFPSRPGNNILLTGHRVLYDFISTGNMESQVTLTTYINLRFHLDQDTIKEIVDSFTFKKETVDENGHFFNRTYETILQYFRDDCNDLVSTLPVHSPGLVLCNEVSDINVSPIGNTCFSSTSDDICYVETSDIFENMRSIFWGLAVGLKLYSIDNVDENTSIYDDVEADKLDKDTIYHMVDAIAGFNPRRMIGIIRDGNGSNINGGGNNDNGPSQGPDVVGDDPKSWRPESRGNNKKPKPSNDKGKSASSTPKTNAKLADSIRNRAALINGHLMNFFSDVDQIVNDENIVNLAKILRSVAFGVSTAKQLHKYKGKSIQFMLQDLNIKPPKLQNINSKSIYILNLNKRNNMLIAKEEEPVIEYNNTNI